MAAAKAAKARHPKAARMQTLIANLMDWAGAVKRRRRDAPSTAALAVASPLKGRPYSHNILTI
jgi:hypothetical protein